LKNIRPTGAQQTSTSALSWPHPCDMYTV